MSVLLIRFTPIFVKNKHIVTWLVGQFCTLDVDKKRIESFGKEIGADVEGMLNGFDELKKRDIKEFEAGMNLLCFFSKWISNISYASYKFKMHALEREADKEAIRQSQGKLDAMLSSIPDHISMMDKELNMVWANNAAKKIFGDDIIGKKCYELYHGRKKPCVPYPCLALESFKDGQIHKHDTEAIGKDGSKIYFHCTANVALKNKKGEPEAVIEISRDITDRVKLDEEKDKNMKEMEIFYKAFVNREDRIWQLKEEIRQLKELLGKK